MRHAHGYDDSTHTSDARAGAGRDEPVPLSAQHGRCGVSAMPRDRVVLTCEGRFLIITDRDAEDLHAALGEVIDEGRRVRRALGGGCGS